MRFTIVSIINTKFLYEKRRRHNVLRTSRRSPTKIYEQKMEMKGERIIENASIIYTYKLRFSTLIEFMRPAYQSARC